MTKNIYFFVWVLFSIGTLLNSPILFAQSDNNSSSTQQKNQKLEKTQKNFSKTLALVESGQFVFQAEFGQGSDMVFVLVDTLYCEVQNGNRNNLDGKITQFEIKKNEKKHTISIKVKMRGEIYVGDVFIFLAANGSGRATVKSDIVGNFTFDGQLFDFENSQIYEGRSHFIN